MRRPAHVPSLLRLLVLAALLPAAACDRSTLAEGVTDSTFVATMAELERIDRSPSLDSAGRAAARAATLQRRGLTRAQLEAAAASLADDPKRALELYRIIERRASGDTTPFPQPTPGTVPRRR